MPKKLTYEFVKEAFELEGYTLISNEYVNAKTKLKYICPNGHKHSINWNSWKSGHRCLYCSGKVKPEYNFVRSAFEKEGYILLSDKYVNHKTKLKYICDKGHQHSIRWFVWKKGVRCPYCAGNVKLSIDKIRKAFEKEGYILRSKEYINNNTKLKYTCPRGHNHSISWGSWHNGNRCPYCAGLNKPSIEDVKRSFESEGFTLLSKKYINSLTKLSFICPNGHEHSVTWSDWKNAGVRCPYCSGKAKLTFEIVKKSFEDEDYTLISDSYERGSVKLKYKCPEGHQHSMTWDNWRAGNRCPSCYYLSRFGEGNPSWRGGKSFETYCPIWKDQEFKTDIRSRDGNRCLNPYCYGKDRTMSIHHIDYNKKNCNPSNLITICRSCNARANKDRSWHKSWYRAIMQRRYNYKY